VPAVMAFEAGIVMDFEGGNPTLDVTVAAFD
jgi:hypothetical protein